MYIIINVNKGTYKKFLSSLFGIFLLFISAFYLFAPNKNEVIFAQTTANNCRVDSDYASFVVTDPLFQQEGAFTENFEKGFLSSTRDVEVRVRLVGCKDREIFMEILSASNNNREDFKKGTATYTGSTVTTGAWEGQTKYKVKSDDALVTFKLKAGEQECSGAKCSNYFRIYRILTLQDKQAIVGPTGNANSINTNDRIFESSRTPGGVVTFQKSASGNTLWEIIGANPTESAWQQGSSSIGGSSCSIKDALIIPSNTDSMSNKEWGENYLTDPVTQEVQIKVLTENCQGKSVHINLYENAGTSPIKSFESNALTINQSPSITNFFIRPGDEGCRGNRGGSDCRIHFEVVVKIDSTKNVKYTSLNDKIGGRLDYEDNGNGKNDPFIFLRATEESGSTLSRTWYWQSIDGVWFNSQKTTEEECRQIRNNATNSNRDVDCTQNPDADKIADGSQAGQPVTTDVCSITNGFTGIGWCFANLIELLVTEVIGGLVGIAAKFFDMTFEYSISSESYGGRGNDISFIKDSWTLIRDLANLGFIFVLLFLSIQQIVSPKKTDVKKDLPKIIIIAIFINFSFFIGSFIVDVSNVLARAFFNNDTICVDSGNNGRCSGSLSEGLAFSLKPQQIIKSSADALSSNGYEKISPGLSIIISLFSGFMLWKIFKAFFTAGFLFLGRIVQIWIMLIISPLAFLNDAIPGKTKVPSNKMANGVSGWASELLKNAMVAPLFMIMIYLVFISLQKLNLAFAFTETDGLFASLIGLFIPVYAITMVIEKIVSYSQDLAGGFAKSTSDLVKKIGGTVLGGGLALGGLAFGGAMVKGGGKILGKLGQGMVNREGKGSNAISRWGNSKLASFGGKINQYSKDLPDKKFDPRGSTWAKKVAGATGVDMNSLSKETNQYLGYVGLKPGTSFKQRQEDELKDKEADIKRRKINEKTEKMDSELAAEYNARIKKMQDEILKEDSKSGKLGDEYQKAKEEAQKIGKDAPVYEKWKDEYLKQNYATEVKSYIEKNSKSEDLFKAKTREEYEKAAKKYNEKIEDKFVEKEMRKVFGGKDKDETRENLKNDNKKGTGARDVASVTGATAGAGFAAAAFGAAATGGATLATAGLSSAMAYEDRQSSLEFIRRRENKKDSATEKKRAKFDEDISKQELKNIALDSELERLENSIKILSSELKNNTTEIKDSSNKTIKFGEVFEKKIAEQNKKFEETLAGKTDEQKKEAIKKNANKAEQTALHEAIKEMDKQISDSILSLTEKLKESSDAEKAVLEQRISELKSKRSTFDNELSGYSSKIDKWDKIRSAKEKGEGRINKLQEERKKLGASEEKKEDKKDDKK